MLLTDHERQENISYVMLNETTLSIEFYKLLPYYAYDVTATAFNSKGISPPSTFQALTGEEGRRIKIKANTMATRERNMKNDLSSAFSEIHRILYFYLVLFVCLFGYFLKRRASGNCN